MMFVRSFSTTSRPALRAAACGGRPRAGSDTTITAEPTSPSTQGSDVRETPVDKLTGMGCMLALGQMPVGVLTLPIGRRSQHPGWPRGGLPNSVRYGCYRLTAVDRLGALNASTVLDQVGLPPTWSPVIPRIHRHACQHSGSLRPALRSTSNPNELHRCASAAQCPVTNIDCHRLKEPTCYVEVMSFKFIRFSVFCPEWGREACRETTDILVGRGKCPPPGAVERNVRHRPSPVDPIAGRERNSHEADSLAYPA